ncbi:MAG TPA: DUF4065 domain-containing protein [bacterium]|jgi:hypothetical protein|nr:DUF4065 domain-containing protein [bacterium]
MTLIDLLYLIAKRFYDRSNYGISKTKLIKLAYLAEIYYKRLTGNRLTDADWIFWQYGPYIMDYPKFLQSNAFVLEPTEGDFQPILPADDYSQANVSIEEKLAVSRAMEFSDEDLNELLDFVYFDTEPMINAGERGEKLDFDCVRPEEEYKIKELILSRESQKKIRGKIEEWKKNARK